MPPSNSARWIGKQLGPYRVHQRIGMGGMGEVYLAHDEALDRNVAIKVLLDVYSRDPDLVQRFQREARAAARLNHPNIVQIHSVDVTSDPPYMAMEYIDGLPLDKRIGPDRPIPWQQALLLCQQVAAALSAAHAQGVVHRDIKPGNIMLDRSGRVRVTDFGIAKVVGSATRLTAERMTIGSPNYMSPEQCGVGTIGPQSDLFSLGITTYEMITGRVPFDSETTLGIIRKITQDALPRMDEFAADVPPVVQAFVQKLTAKDPALRYANASQVMEDIQCIRSGESPRHLEGWTRAQPIPGSQQSLVPQIPGQQSGLALADEMLEGTVAKYPRYTQSNARSVPWAWVAVGCAALAVLVLATVVLRNRGDSARQPRNTQETPQATPTSPRHPDPAMHPFPPLPVAGQPPLGQPPPGSPPPFRPGGPATFGPEGQRPFRGQQGEPLPPQQRRRLERAR